MGKASKGILALLFLGAFLWGVTHTQEIKDWWTLRNYEPSQQIRALADASGMSDSGERIFFVGEPQLNSKEDFNYNCSFTEQSIVLGCYSNQDIFILDVQDDRLAGVEEVTAAHEMLHAAYDRLDPGEKERVNRMLDEQFKVTTNPRTLQLIEQYRESSEETLYDEMHSIFGTELRELNGDLEEYYKQYFEDRAKVVSLAEAYEAVFIGLEEKIKELEAEILSLRDQITNSEDELRSLKSELDSLSAELDAYERGNDVEEYNQLVPRYNLLVNRFNSLLASYNSLIEEHNAKVEERNDSIFEQSELIQSLDSGFQPI